MPKISHRSKIFEWKIDVYHCIIFSCKIMLLLWLSAAAAAAPTCRSHSRSATELDQQAIGWICHMTENHEYYYPLKKITQISLHIIWYEAHHVLSSLICISICFLSFWILPFSIQRWHSSQRSKMRSKADWPAIFWVMFCTDCMIEGGPVSVWIFSPG